ncbi:hypothetical protein D9756_005519 [Leucocoprinus leucothites]|uniref:Aminotransferase class V domain-containing protein n=1 Tax=Leucocoprinus leucothites TaxID=201217 RepID=A0A8H5D7F9_9AGAR|nr:hypothetical protein D9756_005519 [Leucoagaricus leucothites]
MGNTTSSVIALPLDPPPYSRERRTTLPDLLCCGSAADEQTEQVLHAEEKVHYNDQPRPIPPPAYFPSVIFTHALGSEAQDFAKFLQKYPEYALTSPLDTLRETQYTRLALQGETYVDYTGGGMYPEILTSSLTEFLNTNVLGNTHSVNNSSKLSMKCADEARKAALQFFGASEDEYTVVFTPNATGALKLVGESFPFAPGGSYVLSADSHNSVNGVRQFALDKGAELVYIPTGAVGGVDNMLDKHKPAPGKKALLILTAQSNATNSKMDLSLIEYAAKLGYNTMVDAAAWLPCTPISLSEVGADAMCVSFYKMFGYPTGLGALVAKKKFLLDVLQRPWFGGGTINLVQAPGKIMIRNSIPNERFEDGTINYASTKAITLGLNFLSLYQPYTGVRISTIMHYMCDTVPTIVHDSGCKERVAEIVSRDPGPRVTEVGKHPDTGTITALLFYDNSNKLLPISFIEFAAAKNNISLRGGCLCNPGGVAAMMGIQKQMEELDPHIKSKEEWEKQLGRELGVIRVSWGLVSNFQDAWNVLQFVRLIGNAKAKEKLWKEYCDGKRPPSQF